jgi:type IV pilus assembly protein PilO
LLLVAILAVALAAVYQQMVWTPKNLELTKLSARVDALDSLNTIAKREVAKGTTAKMKQEADAYSRELDVLRHLVPTQNEVPALLEAISNAARRAGLELSDVQPDGVMNGDRFDTYRYKMGVTGPYHKVADFLANVGALPRIVAPINIALTTSTRTTGEIKPAKDEQFLDAKFQVQTYVAHVAPPANIATSKAGAP